jgi:uncharacterized protein YdhG (YjbR/CyaY superfamily)
MKSNATSKDVDKYIAGFPRPVQTVLKRVRSIIRTAVPGADEAISYGIPTFRFNGRYVAAFKDDLAPYELSGKGTIRFPLGEPVPEKLIAAIAKFRAKEVAEREKATASAGRAQRGRRESARRSSPRPRQRA